MAHFARIDKNNIVQKVIVVDNIELLNESGNEEEDFGIVFLNNLFGAGFTWVQTSYNGNFRKNYAGVGYTYDKTRDAFIEPIPFGVATTLPPLPSPTTVSPSMVISSNK